MKNAVYLMVSLILAALLLIVLALLGDWKWLEQKNAIKTGHDSTEGMEIAGAGDEGLRTLYDSK